jgi:phosphoglycerate dehydrogenase-like enzyme
MKVLYLGIPSLMHPWYDDFLAAVAGRHQVVLFDPERPLADQFRDADVVVELGGSVADRAMIDAGIAANVKLWQVVGTGLDHVDVAYFLEKGVLLANTPGIFSAIALAEHALFLMLCLAKNLRASDENVRAGVFSLPLNSELAGKTLGLVGLGASGRELAKRAWALGMRVMAMDMAEVPRAVLDETHVDFFGGPGQLNRVVAEADYLSLHVPLTATTRNMIDGKALARMKPTAVLINVARGGIVDETALIDGLQKKRIRGAGLDAFVREPLEPAHPLLHMDNVIATPHIAGGTAETSRRRMQAAAENIMRVAQGLPPLYRVTSV